MITSTPTQTMRLWSEVPAQEREEILAQYQELGPSVLGRKYSVNYTAITNAFYSLKRKQKNGAVKVKKVKKVKTEKSHKSFSIAVSGINVHLSMPDGLKVENVALTNQEITLTIK